MKLYILLVYLFSNIAFADFSANITICHNTEHCESFFEDKEKYPDIQIEKLKCPKISEQFLDIFEEKYFLSIFKKNQKILSCDDLEKYWEKKCNLDVKDFKKCKPLKFYIKNSRKYRLLDIIFPEVSKSIFKKYHRVPRPQGNSTCMWYRPVQSSLVESDQKICERIKGTTLESYQEIFTSNEQSFGGLLNQWSRDNYLEMIRAAGIQNIKNSYEKIFGYPYLDLSEKKCPQFTQLSTNNEGSNKKYQSSIISEYGQEKLINDAKNIQILISKINETYTTILTPLIQYKANLNAQKGYLYLSKSGNDYLKQLDEKEKFAQQKIKEYESYINAYLAKNPLLTIDRKSGYFDQVFSSNKLYENQPWISKIASLQAGTKEADEIISIGSIKLEKNIENTIERFCKVPTENFSKANYQSCINEYTSYSGNNPNKIKLKQLLINSNKLSIKAKSELKFLKEELCSKEIEPFKIDELVQMKSISDQVLKAYPEYKSFNQCLVEESQLRRDFYVNAGIGLGIGCIGAGLIFPPFALFCGATDIALVNYERIKLSESQNKFQQCRFSNDICSPELLKKSLESLQGSSRALILSIFAEGAGAIFDIGSSLKKLPSKARLVTSDFITNQKFYSRLNFTTQQHVLRNLEEIQKLPRKKLMMALKNLNKEIKSIVQSQDQLIREIGNLKDAKRLYPCLF